MISGGASEILTVEALTLGAAIGSGSPSGMASSLGELTLQMAQAYLNAKSGKGK